MSIIEIDGVDMYYERHGSGDPVVLLHGGFCSIEMMRPQLEALAGRYEVLAFERPGHGRTPDDDAALSYDRSLAHTLGFLDAMDIERAHIVGFSDGAIIGLLAALRHPSRLLSLIAISGNLDPSGFASEGDAVRVGAMDLAVEQAETPDRTTQLYNELSPDGPEHAEVMLAKLYRLWTTEPAITPASLAAIDVPTMVMAGDRDSIRLDHSALIAASITGAHLCIVPGAGHLLLDEKPALATHLIEHFLHSRE